MWQANESDPSSHFQMAYDNQRPVSHVDFFSSVPTKDSDDQSQQGSKDAVTDGHNFFEQAQLPHQSQGASGGWPFVNNAWAGSGNNQLFYQAEYGREAENSVGHGQVKQGNNQLSYSRNSMQSSDVGGVDFTSRSMHAFLPPTKIPREGGQTANVGMQSAQGNTHHPTVIKSMPRNQPFPYDGLLNGSGSLGYRSVSSTDGPDFLRGHLQNQTTKFGNQNLGNMSQFEVPQVKAGDYDFQGGQHVFKGQQQGQVPQQVEVDNVQPWNSSVQQQNQQHHGYHYHHSAQVDQTTQPPRQQLQPLMVGPNQVMNSHFSALLNDGHVQEMPPVLQSERSSTSQLGLDGSRLPGGYNMMTNNGPNNSGLGNPAWITAPDSPLLNNDYLVGQGHNFSWQEFMKASQLDAGFGSFAPRRDTAGQGVGGYAGMPLGMHDVYSNVSKPSVGNTQVGKPIPRTLGAATSTFGEFQGITDVSNTHHSSRNSKYQSATGKVSLGQSAQGSQQLPHSVDPSTLNSNAHQQTLQSRNVSDSVSSQVRPQRSWSSQQDSSSQVSNLLSNAQRSNILSSSSLQHNRPQAGTFRQPTATLDLQAPRNQSLAYMPHASAQGGSLFLNSLDGKLQAGWNSVQHGTSQVGSSSSVADLGQQNSWSVHNVQQMQEPARSQQLFGKPKHQSIWGIHSAQQGTQQSGSALHLFNDADTANRVHAGHSLQQSSFPGAAPQALGKVDVNQQLSQGGLGSQHTNVNQRTNDSESRGQNGWRAQNLLQGGSHAGQPLQSFSDVGTGAANNWRLETAWSAGSQGESSSQLADVEARQQNSLRSHNLRQSATRVGHPSSIGSAEASAWTKHPQSQLDSSRSSFLFGSVDLHQQRSQQDRVSQPGSPQSGHAVSNIDGRQPTGQSEDGSGHGSHLESHFVEKASNQSSSLSQGQVVFPYGLGSDDRETSTQPYTDGGQLSSQVVSSESMFMSAKHQPPSGDVNLQQGNTSVWTSIGHADGNKNSASQGVQSTGQQLASSTHFGIVEARQNSTSRNESQHSNHVDSHVEALTNRQGSNMNSDPRDSALKSAAADRSMFQTPGHMTPNWQAYVSSTANSSGLGNHLTSSVPPNLGGQSYQAANLHVSAEQVGVEPSSSPQASCLESHCIH